MKIKSEDYDKLDDAIRALFAKGKTTPAEMLKEYREKGLSAKRVRWDCLYLSDGNRQVRELYRYLADSHIDTALRRIFRKLTEESAIVIT